MDQKEKRTILAAISILATQCAGDGNTIISVLTGYLWSEEEAGELEREILNA